MENSCLLSVIVPVYNCERYILECIKSIESQNFPNMELILVDDGSTDSSGHICDKISSLITAFPVSVIHQKNGALPEK